MSIVIAAVTFVIKHEDNDGNWKTEYSNFVSTTYNKS